MQESQDSMSLTEISGMRRHIYFYSLLILGTVVIGDLWRKNNGVDSACANEIVRIQRVVAEVLP